MKISGAIFDLDGTLTDSMAIWEEAPCALVRLYGKTPPENLAQALTQMSREEAARYLIQTFDLPAQPQQILVDINDLVTGYYRDTAPLKPGAAMLIERLAKAQIPMCIATASEVFQARDAMERLGQWRYFQFALSCMRFGGKTDPNIYLQAANRLGAAPGRIVVFVKMRCMRRVRQNRPDFWSRAFLIVMKSNRRR
jgi:beta-phosphoglucomutase-like phosphatase (HAD superfamily)